MEGAGEMRKLYARPKYGNVRQSYGGHQYDSKGEAGYAQDLDLMVKAGEIKSYERQVSFDLHGVNGGKVCVHRVDFLVLTNEGKQEVHEYKGFATAVWDLKRKLFEDEYPEIEYIVIK